MICSGLSVLPPPEPEIILPGLQHVNYYYSLQGANERYCDHPRTATSSPGLVTSIQACFALS